MKRLIIVLSFLLILVGCTNTNTVSVKPDTIINQLEKKFNYETGKVLKDNVDIIYRTSIKDEIIDIVSEDSDYYYFNDNNLLLSIEKLYVRKESENTFESYIAYTRKNSSLYSDVCEYYILDSNDIIHTFNLNDKVKVLDVFYDVAYVEYEGNYGYMHFSLISKTEIVEYVAPKTNNSSNESYSGGGSQGGSTPSSGGGGSSSPAPSSGDGEDISLAFKESDVTTYLLANESTTKGRILLANMPIYITKLNRGDEAKILDTKDDYYIILFNGHKVSIPIKYVRKDSEEAFVSFKAYTANYSVIYDGYQKVLRINSLNDIVTVIDEVDRYYVVEYSNGQVGYMVKETVSKEEYKVYTPKANTSSNESYSGGGSSNVTPSTPSSGGSEPSGGSGDSEWTEPAL